MARKVIDTFRPERPAQPPSADDITLQRDMATLRQSLGNVINVIEHELGQTVPALAARHGWTTIYAALGEHGEGVEALLAAARDIWTAQSSTPLPTLPDEPDPEPEAEPAR